MARCYSGHFAAALAGSIISRYKKKPLLIDGRNNLSNKILMPRIRRFVFEYWAAIAGAGETMVSSRNN